MVTSGCLRVLIGRLHKGAPGLLGILFHNPGLASKIHSCEYYITYLFINFLLSVEYKLHYVYEGLFLLFFCYV